MYVTWQNDLLCYDGLSCDDLRIQIRLLYSDIYLVGFQWNEEDKKKKDKKKIKRLKKDKKKKGKKEIVTSRLLGALKLTH